MKELNIIENYIEDNKLDIEKVMNDFTSYIYTVLINKNSMLSDEDIEEIISYVFLAVWKNQKQLDITKKMSSYLVGITNNVYCKKFRKLSNDVDISQLDNNIYENSEIENYIELKEKNNIIINEINNMKSEDKKIFMMYYYYSKSMREISKELNIKEEKVKSRLHRIRKKIKKILEKRGYSYNG